MLNRTILHLALLSVLLLVSMTESCDAQNQEKKEKEASDPAVTARVANLIEGLKDKDSSVRSLAAFALGQIGPAAKDAVPTLIEALKDKDARVRSSAAFALGRIGLAAKDAVPALKAMSENDPADIVRNAAATALERINK